jgi:hypothetical protein
VLVTLLRAARRQRRDLALARFRDADVDWAVATGLAPLLVWTAAGDPEAAASPHWPRLRAADLAARALAEEHLDAATEIIDACAGATPPLTLLKGISLCEAYYPAPQLRPMRDIDLLVARSAVPAVENVLRALGYREYSAQRADTFRSLHHGVPLVHPRTGIWVEVHHRLFPSQRRATGDEVFSPEHVEQHSGPSAFRARLVNRLRPELAIPYIASHWARSSRLIHGAGGMLPMLDVMYVLDHVPQLRWYELLQHSSGSPTRAHVHLLLSYLTRYDLADVPPDVMEELAATRRSVAGLRTVAVHAILDWYVADPPRFGSCLTRRNLKIIWESLVEPGSLSRNLLILPLHLVWDISWRPGAAFRALLRRMATSWRSSGRHLPARLRAPLCGIAWRDRGRRARQHGREDGRHPEVLTGGRPAGRHPAEIGVDDQPRSAASR